MGISKIIFSPESHHPPHPCISAKIRHHPSAQLVVLFIVVSSFSRVVAISPSTPCLLLDKFTAPEFRKVARELSDPFSSFPFSLLRTRPRPPALLRRRSPQSRLLPRAKPYPPPPRRLELRNRDHWPLLKTPGFSTGALGFHWYRLEIPAGTKEASMLT